MSQRGGGTPAPTTDPGLARRLGRRWPTLLAVGCAALTVGGGERGGQVAGLAEVLLLLPLVYLVVAGAGRRSLSWPVLIASVVLMFGLRLADVVPATTVIVAILLGALIWSVLGGHALRSGVLRIQALGTLGFGALALVALAVDADLGRYLVAAGWFLHGVWDFVHLKLDKVVARSYAECCGVLDILIAVHVIALL